MKRRVLVIAVFLLGGVVVNVATAWWFSDWIEEGHTVPRFLEAWDRHYSRWPYFAFVITTLLYATSLWLLIPGPFALRRFIRVKRGLCPACAYPRGESDVCSECGKALAKRATVIAYGELGDS